MALSVLKQTSVKLAKSGPTFQFLNLHCSSVFRLQKKIHVAANHEHVFVPLDSGALTSTVKYRLAREKYLPGSHGKGIPEFISNPRPGLPQAYQILEPDRYSLSEWASLCRGFITDMLPIYGVILFRGLPLLNGDLFSSFVKHLGFTPKGYEGGAAYRPSYDEKAATYISTLMDKRFNIEPHCDMAYAVDSPRKVFFYCDVPAADGCGGLTPITLGTEILNKLDPDVVEKFEKKQVRYHHCLPSEGNGYLPWQVTFRTKDRKVVEKLLQEMDIAYEWRDNNTLLYWIQNPAIITHPITGERVWFNQIDTHHNSYHRSSPMLENVTYKSDFDYPNHTTYGDGTPIEPDVLQHIRATKWQNTVCVQLRKNDLIVFDNNKVLHGRLSYTGKRRILVFMSKD